MPLATDSTYTHLVAAIEKAYEVSSAMEEQDPEFDLQGLDEPKFGNHSLRRHGDKLARMEMERSGADKQMIDYYFGWLLKEMMKDMQLHYAGFDRYMRRVLARVMMYF